VCDLRIVLADGKALEGRCLIMKGEPANPHTAAELEGKFMQLGAPVWVEESSRRLLEGCLRVESVPDFGIFADGFNL